MARIDFDEKIIHLKLVVDDIDGESAVRYIDYVASRSNVTPLRSTRDVLGGGGAMLRVYELIPLALGEVRGFKVAFALNAIWSPPPGHAEDIQALYADADGAILLVDRGPEGEARLADHDRTRSAAFEVVGAPTTHVLGYLGPFVRERDVDLESGRGALDLLKLAVKGMLTDLALKPMN